MGIRQRPHGGAAGLHNLLHVTHGPVDVELRRIALQHQHVALAVHLEFAGHRAAGDDGAVDERVEVFGHIGVRRARQRHERRGRARPSHRQLEPHFVRTGTAVDQRQERGRTVEHGKVALDPVVAHGHLAAVDAVAYRHRARTAGRHAPPVLGRLDDDGRLAVGGGGHALDMALVLAHEVRPGRPHGHVELDGGLPPGRVGRLDVDVMGARIGKAQRVADGLGRLGAEFGSGQHGNSNDRAGQRGKGGAGHWRIVMA